MGNAGDRGDALVFVSEKWHNVEEVLAGSRRSLVTLLLVAYTQYNYMYICIYVLCYILYVI